VHLSEWALLQDGKTDCQDPDCAHFFGCRKDNPNTESGPECHDGHDNDHDGKDDCKDPDCARHPCCTGLCKQKIFQTQHPFCTQKYCVASGQSANAGGAACNSARLLPTVLTCQTWLRQAERDGVITTDDGFCTSCATCSAAFASSARAHFSPTLAASHLHG
jgi:hypothetical protein